ncbi:hypothetical protein HYW82_02425 [Candidatus Peregrinibacteria bacterium]|nr:hypothetical protein [Candidatus Peregrinibacteria bacterium]
MLKCQFHTHVLGDPVDRIKYTANQLIDHAAMLHFDVLAITCHRKIIFTKELKEYAEKKGILLITGIEFEIGKKHVLGINIDEGIYEVDSFEKLRAYRANHPDCLIIAPHPFFPGPCLKKDLLNNIDLFDAIEISWAYTKTIDFNKKAIKLATKYNKPLIATADCHILNYLNIGYCLIDSARETDSVIKAIKQNKIQNNSHPATYREIADFFFQQIFASQKSFSHSPLPHSQ